MASRFWVGGTGTWNTTFNWSATSGGAGGASVPIATDDVVFDANSGLVGNLVSTCDIAFTINNLTITTSATVGNSILAITVSLTVNGTLSCSGTAGNRRFWIRGTTYGLAQNLTVAATSNLADLDFRDIYVLGAAGPISGTRIGNRGECRGITFSTPKTVYWNLAGAQNWSANGWATTSTGTPSTDNFPLPQDTATFTNAGAITSLTLDTAIAYTGTVDFSTRTNAVTISINATTIYGNWTSGSGITWSGNTAFTFSGGTTQTITSNGKAFTNSFTVDTYGGTVQLADALSITVSNPLTVTNGTFTTNGYAVTALQLLSSNSNVRAINLGASAIAVGSSVTFTTSTNLTFSAGTSTITITGGGATSIDGGSGLTFYNCIFPGTTTSGSVTGANTFNNLTIVAPAAAGFSLVGFGAKQTISGTLTCTGATVLRRVFLRSTTVGTQQTLTVNTLLANDCDFRDINLAGAAIGATPTRAGDCGGNTGIVFPAAKTVYWNLAGANFWSATGWATSSGGTPAVNNFPLAQDTAVFDNTGSVTAITIDASWNLGTFNASARTSTMTLSIGTAIPLVYGDWTWGTGVTSSSTTGTLGFVKSGTQTITSNGVQFGFAVAIGRPLAYVQLADALSLASVRTLTLTTGTFDAVTYNVTTGVFTNGNPANTLKMGSGTWTLSGTGAVWNCATAPIVIAGTSTIVLSDTSATARTFASGGGYYNKLTIGGTTGTSTLIISGANTFGELASTKTVAHTILFTSTATYNIGKWSVTGTAGNVVTIGPSTAATAYTINIYGPANTGIDYLSVSYCTLSTTSPGELYVGANSTNTAGNTGAIIFTATPSPRNLFWVGGTGNWSSTTKWATTSGGVSGAAIPTSLDTVTFDNLSSVTPYAATIDAGVTIARCAAFTLSGTLTNNVTFAGAVGIAMHGNVYFSNTRTNLNYTGDISFAGNSSYTLTTNGLSINSNLLFVGIGSTWTLGDTLSIAGGPSKSMTITYGNFSTSASNYLIYLNGPLNSNNSNIRSLNLNGSIIRNTLASALISITPTTNLTFNAGTSQIIFNNSTNTLTSGGLTFYDVSFTSAAAATISISGTNTFNTLSFAGVTTAGSTPVTFSANQTIGTLTLNAGTSAVCRTFLASSVIGTPITLAVTTLTSGAADYDFRDIVVTGTAAPLTGTRFGDCKGNSGITFPAAKTVYYRQTGSASWGAASPGSWAATSGGSLDATQFPLAQDTAIFPASTYPASGSTTTINASYNIGTIDMSARTTNTMTLATGTILPTIYGNWINGTGTTLTGTGAITFAGRGSQTITSAGKTFTQQFTINTLGGSVTLQDAFSASQNLSGVITVLAGTFDAGTYNITLSGATSSVIGNAVLTRTIAIGSGTWTIAGSGTAWSTSTPTNLTVTGTGTISLTSASGKFFTGGGLSYSGITLNQGGVGSLTISGNNTFKDITNTYNATGATSILFGGTTQTVTQWTGTGTAGKVLSISGTTGAAPATLILTGPTDPNVDYLSISNVRAYPL
ncbi:Parallel beta-helix repeat [uncultured Caudovirales phage]|uniref:Parallel beta-helix repeat n=1 Tax=uncultured Caudovirales phage TaxID=2100421 RepID=A0A6J5T8W4_9CAUD|nr:Parallel beta-helix repeat [uncultured Caudovirales phage]